MLARVSTRSARQRPVVVEAGDDAVALIAAMGVGAAGLDPLSDPFHRPVQAGAPPTAPEPPPDSEKSWCRSRRRRRGQRPGSIGPAPSASPRSADRGSGARPGSMCRACSGRSPASNRPSAARASIGDGISRLLTSSRRTTCAARAIAASTLAASPRCQKKATLPGAPGHISGASAARASSKPTTAGRSR